MDKKYQVFVSSTFEDLKEHRDQAVKTILRMGHLPVGMEMFNAADSTQWEIIKRHIDNSDYYIVILAHRYGSVDKDGVSYTEKEYNYATEKGIPCLGFVIDSNADWNPKLVAKGKDAVKLDNFKDRIKNRMISFWTSIDNLSLQIFAALSQAFNTDPRIGWIRANEVTTSPLVAEELSRLSKRNEELTAQLASQNKLNEINDLIKILDERKYVILRTNGGNSAEITLLQLFLLVCENQAQATALIIQTKVTNEPYSMGNDISSISVALDELALLGLVSRVIAAHLTYNPIIYTITEKGQQVYTKHQYYGN